MSETSYTALEGKVCVITLRGTAGTNYCWCLTSQPKELALFSVDSQPEPPYLCGGTYQEHFYFLVKGSEETEVKLEFEELCLSDYKKTGKTCTVDVLIIPANSSDFTPLDSVAQVQNIDSEAMLKYGYPCGAQDNQQRLAYGYPCGMQDNQQMMKYGYPCGVQDSQQMLKYGYPCGVQDNQQMMKYGYPCGM